MVRIREGDGSGGRINVEIQSAKVKTTAVAVMVNLFVVVCPLLSEMSLVLNECNIKKL